MLVQFRARDQTYIIVVIRAPTFQLVKLFVNGVVYVQFVHIGLELGESCNQLDITGS